MLNLFDIQKKNKNKTITELIDEAFSNQNIYTKESKIAVAPETKEKLQPKLEPFREIDLSKSKNRRLKRK